MVNDMKYKTFNYLFYIALFLFSAASFYFLIYAAFTNIINDFNYLKIYLPLFLTFLVPISSLIFAGLNRYTNGKKLKKTIFIFSIVLISYSSLTLIYTLIDIFAFLGGNFIYKGITNLFPLDMIVYNVIYLVIGIMVLISSKKMIADESVPTPKHNIFIKLLAILSVLVTAYFAGEFLLIPAMLDYSFRHIWGMIPLFLLMILPTVGLILYWFIYPIIKVEKRDKFAFRHSLYLIGLTLIFSIWVLTYELFNNSFLVEGNQAFFPITFASSMSIGVAILFLNSFVPPLVAAIILFVRHKKSVH